MSKRTFNHLVRLGAIVIDFLAIWVSFTIAWHLREQSGLFSNDVSALTRALMHWKPLASAAWLVVIACFGGYAVREFGSGTVSIRRALNAGLFNIGFFSLVLYMTTTEFSRSYFLLLFIIAMPLITLGRLFGRRILHWLHRRGYGISRVIIVGRPQQAEQFSRMLKGSAWLGLEPYLVFDPDEALETYKGDHRSISDNLLKLAESTQAELVLFAPGSVPDSVDFRRYVWRFEGHRTQLAVVPSLVDVAADRIRTRPVGGLPLVYVEDPNSAGALSHSKRIFDIVMASLALIMVSPVMIITALAVYFTDRGPVFFRQERVGRDGKTFKMIKFRSMVVDAEARLAQLQGGNKTNEVMFKLKKDPRITPVGGFIRRFSIDELPQLFNVIQGDMSLIGPRPPLPREVAKYTPDEMRRLRVRPGITGLWQISGRSDLSWDETIRLDLYYIDNWSPLQDLSILTKTVQAVLSSRGAY